MPKIPDDFKQLLPPKVANPEPPWKGPVYYYWVFDPVADVVHIDHNQDRHRAYTITLYDIAPEVTHPSREQGYAYKIKGGYRITNDDHKPVLDPHVKDAIMKALRKENPPKPLLPVHPHA